MLVRKRGIQLRQRASRQRSFTISVHNVIRILSSLILPLTLGVFTVVITVFQHVSSQEDRRVDLRRADEQRDKDIERFEHQRREDRNETRTQRQQEMLIAKLQRQQEWNISKVKQNIQNKANVDRYQDEIFRDYVKEIGDLMEKNNGSLTSNPLISTLAHVKTLNVLRQLDGSRQIHVIRFLHEVAKLTKTDETIPLIMSTAELTNVDFRYVTWTPYILSMSFPQLYLRNCTFANTQLIQQVNFTSTRFDHVNFSSIDIVNVDFSFARFGDVNFSRTRIFHTNFSSIGAKNISFSFTNLTNINFSSVWLFNANFSSARFNRSTFSFAKLRGANFSSAKSVDLDFASVHLAGSSSSFRGANMARTVFVDCNCKMADFSYANLSESVFSNANLKNASFQNANLTHANFTGANLCNADLTNTTISDAQLQSARSIHNAKLPNGTFGRLRNLLENGNANCNIPSLAPWYIQTGEVSVVISKEARNDCRFLLQSHLIGATMWQGVSVIDIWNSNFSTDSNIEVRLRRSDGVSVELYGQYKNGTVLQKEIFNGSGNNIVMKLKEDMLQVEVMVRFNASPRDRYVWCDDIELFINYDMLERPDSSYLRK